MAHDATNLTCKEVVELVTEFLGNTLAPSERVCLEQHLLVCPPCTLHVAQVKATIEFSAMLGKEATPREVNPQLLEWFRKRNEK